MRWRTVASAAAVAMLAGAGLVGAGAPAVAKGGDVGGSGQEYFLNDQWTATANISFTYGAASDEVYVGDWDGNGTDTLAIRRGATFHFRNTNSSGPADVQVTYGRPGDTVLMGDWDGNGTDTFAVRRGAEYHVRNELAGGAADRIFMYGRSSDTVLVGDWDGNGTDTFAVRRGAEYFVRNELADGWADDQVVYGRPGDAVYVGDWDGDRRDTFAVRRGAEYFVKNSISAGAADLTLVYGRTTDVTLVGDWNGDGTDTLGVRRAAASSTPPSAGARTFGDGTHSVGRNGVAPGTYRSTSTDGSCYWARLSGFSGSDSDIIVNGLGVARPIVRIESADVGFESDWCGTWVPVGQTYPASPATRFGDGHYVVGEHIAPGTYRTSGGEYCFWERRAGFSGEWDEQLGWGGGNGAQTATIRSSDQGFVTSGCGTWTRIG
ncbi:hypothetical protein [Georgenia sp. Z1491]|uniref:hypothetical protein n=1 Tax=Georgenia sp. Z1491 TaxID=3416707 RepID=UPI003CF16A5D